MWTNLFQGAAGNSEHDHLRRFRDPEEQFRNLRRVSVGMRCTTIQDVNDGFGDRAASCREYTLSRDDPVLEVKTICHLDVHGIEILITSTSGDSTNYWVVISRGPIHHVETHAEHSTTQSRSSTRKRASQILLSNWYATWFFRKENRTGHFIGNRSINDSSGERIGLISTGRQ